MNFDHLKYFVDAAHSGGVSKSAKENFVTQSAVSRAIRKLEEDLNTALIVHKQNSFQLTEVGEAVLAKSQNIFSAIDEVRTLASSYSKTYQGPLRFGCNQAIASHLVGPVLTELSKNFPQLELTMKLGNTDQVQKMLDQREIDFAIVLNDGEVSRSYEAEDFYCDQFVVVRSPNIESRYDGNDLIVSRTRKGGMSHKYLAAFAKTYGHEIEPKVVIASWQVILDLAIAGYGSAFVPSFICQEPVQAGKLQIVKHRVKPIKYSLCTIVCSGRSLPFNAQALLDLLRS